MAELEPKWSQDGAIMPPRSPKMHQYGPNSKLKWPQRVPRTPRVWHAQQDEQPVDVDTHNKRQQTPHFFPDRDRVDVEIEQQRWMTQAQLPYPITSLVPAENPLSFYWTLVQKGYIARPTNLDTIVPSQPIVFQGLDRTDKPTQRKRKLFLDIQSYIYF